MVDVLDLSARALRLLLTIEHNAGTCPNCHQERGQHVGKCEWGLIVADAREIVK